MKYVFLMFLSQNIQADEWFCRSQTAQRNGNVISACGIGIGLTNEPAARAMALRQALARFQDICYMDDGCRNKKSISANPKRADCEKSGNMTTCYQLIEFTIK